MKEDLKAKVAVITGASMGLGRYLCQYFSGLGLKVAAAARSADKLKSLEQ
jgi:NADP-dependent 3-hydroxy acid dehydrogenase YdfG